MAENFSAASGLELCEELIFRRSQSGVTGVALNQEDISAAISDEEVQKVLHGHERQSHDVCLLPQVSEPDAVRHYTRLSKKNFSIDTHSYPLGSCTMKYNPKIHEWAARLPGIVGLHPYMPLDLLQPALRIMFELQASLEEIGGFAKVSLAPSAGAQGEFAGLAMIKKALSARGDKRKSILVPKSAHGTNPATAASLGFFVISLDIGPDGRMIKRQVDELMNDQCAGLMVTNPNTLGIFESELPDIARIVHERGGFVYGDGANLNALMGITRPGDLGIDVMHFNLHKTMTTPHGGGGPGCGAVGASAELAPFLPTPLIKMAGDRFVVDEERSSSIGAIRSFFGNFGMMIRAWCYIKSLGPDGLKDASSYAVLNANYVREKLKNYYHVAYQEDCLHEVVLSDKYQAEYGVTALDIAKRLIDYGVHPPTMYFPLVVKGALMVEPTETESLYDLDRMIEAFIAVATESQENPQLVKSAPHMTRLSRLDEAQAARKPVLTYQEIVAQR